MNLRTPAPFALLYMALSLGFGSPASAQDSPPTQPSTEAPSAPADPVTRRVTEFEDRTRRIRLGETDRAKEVKARSNNRKNELASLRAQLNVALSMPPASSERAQQVDQTYASLRNLVDRILDDRLQATTVLDMARSDLEAAKKENLNTQSTAESRLAIALSGFIAAHETRVHGVLDEIDIASALLIQARTLRRQAKQRASNDAIAQSEEARLVDIMAEVHAIPLDIESAIRRTTKTWWRAPAELQHVQALGGLFLGLTKLALLLVIGMWMHARLPQWVRKFLESDDHDSENLWEHRDELPTWLIPGDLKAMSAPLGRLVQDLTVAGIALFVMFWVGDLVPLIAWVALIFLCGAAVRMAQDLIELALITPQETRPALTVTDEQVRASLLWFAQAFGMLLAIHLILNHLLVHILGADELGGLFTDAIRAVSIFVALIGLSRWSQLLRARVAGGGSESAIASWIISTEKRRVLSVVGAVGAVVLLSLRALMSLANGFIESRAGLSWLSAVLARRQLRDDKDTAREHLPADIRNSIGQGALRELRFDATIQDIQQTISTWQTDPRRGLIAITGDRGCGKDILLDTIKASLNTPVIHAATPLGHTQEMQALNWLIRVADIDAQPNTESVIKALLDKPSTVFLLSNIHRLFMRAVGHYAGMDAVLDVMQATARHHFWIASLHGPAWSFLAGMNNVGHVGIFPKRIHIGPMNPADMSAWLHKRTRSIGFRPNFQSLLQRPAKGPDRNRLIERTERAFWRLLADASQGNPTVAARLWIDCLRPSSVDGEVGVGVPRSHDSSELEGLSDPELFTLTAIILHDDISVEELHTVLNQSENRVRATCRGLEQATLIMETDSGRYKVRLNWLPAVERHLRRRSFLHKS